MARAALAAAVYFALVFAFAFATGVVRVLWIAPKIGELAAVALEVPAILAVSWVACRWTVRRLSIGPTGRERLTMGAFAFLLLMSVELALSVFAFGRPAGAWLAALATPAGGIGLAAQAAFGLLPLVHPRGRPLPF